MASRLITDLHPIFQKMVKELLTRGQEAIGSEYTFFITDGFRSFDEQTALYAQGRSKPGSIVTNAKAGESAHNHGLAVDCAFQKDGKLYYSSNLYAKVYPIARSLGFSLGADWTGFVDKPHFEYANWKALIKMTTPKEVPMPEDTVAVKKGDFETLVTKSTRYDEIKKAGIESVADLESLRRREEEAKNACSVAVEEAKNTRKSFDEYKQKVADKLNSPQDIDRVLSAIDEMIRQYDASTGNEKKDREQIVKDEETITALKAEVARLELMLKMSAPLSQYKTTELLQEFFRRIQAIMKGGQ